LILPEKSNEYPAVSQAGLQEGRRKNKRFKSQEGGKTRMNTVVNIFNLLLPSIFTEAGNGG
jgi:2-C-methyl-D-erythritol 4-phosphate cytidylyltransferase